MNEKIIKNGWIDKYINKYINILKNYLSRK